jgi:hypothetical protein
MNRIGNCYRVRPGTHSIRLGDGFVIRKGDLIEVVCDLGFTVAIRDLSGKNEHWGWLPDCHLSTLDRIEREAVDERN